MKLLTLTFFAFALLAIGFIAGVFFSNLSTKEKLNVDNERLIFLTELHDFQRKNSRKAYSASDTIMNKIFPLIDDGTLTSKGKVSNDPLKKLLWESYHCISRSMRVIQNYDRQVYPEDSAFLKTYFRLKE